MDYWFPYEMNMWFRHKLGLGNIKAMKVVARIMKYNGSRWEVMMERMELEANPQGKGIWNKAFVFIGLKCLEKWMTEFKIDRHTIKR
jgi:hypothetical protein